MMKKISIFSVCLFVLAAAFTVSCSRQGSSSTPYTISPGNPKAGQELTVTYRPASKSFASAENIQMLAYAYSNDYPTVFSAAMEKQGRRWMASFTPGQDAAGIALKFKSGEEVDNNNGQGYFEPLYGSDGTIEPAATAGQADALANWGRSVLQLEPNRPRALELFNQTFHSHPELKKDFFYTYVRTLVSEKPEGWEKTALEVVDEVAVLDNLDEYTFNILITAYRTLERQEKSESLAEKARQLFPKGYQAQLAEYQKFRTEKDPDKLKAFIEAFKANFPESNMIPTMANQLTNIYRTSDRIADLKTFIEDNPDIDDPYMLSSVANFLVIKEVELDLAAELIQQALDVSERQLTDPDSRPGYLTREEWETRIKLNTISTQLFTLAQIQEKQDNPAEALKTLEKAVEWAGKSRPEINEAYARLLLDQKQVQKAFDALSAAYKTGYAAPAMKDMLKFAYSEVKGTEEGFEAYFEELEENVLNKMREKLAKEIIDLPAPDFSLEDLEGNTISSSALRGKVLVLDFWATWCGPCIRSFPAMKKAQEIFADDPDVQFLFIDTWQKEEDKKANAQAFMAENDYPFHVLLDNEDKVVADFGVEGIPTKFVIDGRGRIRFKKVGFMGNDDQTVKEIRLMIELVK